MTSGDVEEAAWSKGTGKGRNQNGPGQERPGVRRAVPKGTQDSESIVKQVHGDPTAGQQKQGLRTMPTGRKYCPVALNLGSILGNPSTAEILTQQSGEWSQQWCARRPAGRVKEAV